MIMARNMVETLIDETLCKTLDERVTSQDGDSDLDGLKIDKSIDMVVLEVENLNIPKKVHSENKNQDIETKVETEMEVENTTPTSFISGVKNIKGNIRPLVIKKCKEIDVTASVSGQALKTEDLKDSPSSIQKGREQSPLIH